MYSDLFRSISEEVFGSPDAFCKLFNTFASLIITLDSSKLPIRIAWNKFIKMLNPNKIRVTK